MKISHVIFVFCILFISQKATYAGVNSNNGNFFISNIDFTLKTPGMNVQFTRTFNSRSNYIKGLHGVGWSSTWESYLRFQKKDVVYYEGGGGNVIRFSPDKKNLWSNKIYGQQTIKKVSKRYVLKNSQGKFLVFDIQGKLVQLRDNNGNYIDVSYVKGAIALLKDNYKNQINISTKNIGGFFRITKIMGGGLIARYKYDQQGKLLEVVGADGVPYAYEYDEEYNMTKISYRDGTFKKMQYNKVRDWITSLTDRDGTKTDYEYFSDKLDPENKFGTVIKRMIAGAKQLETTKFWYDFRKRPDGTKYNYRAVSSIRGLVSETIYTECCGTPLVISQWIEPEEVKSSTKSLEWLNYAGTKRTTRFEYYDDGLLKKKILASGEITEIAYDKKFRKIASVRRAGTYISYNYDKLGNLATAVDSLANRKLFVDYDGQGRINLISQKPLKGKGINRSVLFRYNPKGQPIEIKEKIGKRSSGNIYLKYASTGQVLGIVDKKGKAFTKRKDLEMARRVASTFQNLLQIVQPTGVSLAPEG